LVAVANKAPAELTMTLPVSMPDSQVNEAVDQFFNLINNSATRTAFKEGFAPT
jgi:hypothetical protein